MCETFGRIHKSYMMVIALMVFDNLMGGGAKSPRSNMVKAVLLKCDMQVDVGM